MDPTALPSAGSGDWAALLLGPLGALVLALIWIWKLSRENTDYRKRNDELSLWLVQHIESTSRERVKMIDDFALRLDSTVRTLLESFTSLAHGRPSSARSIVAPLPPPPERKPPGAS